MKSKAFTLFGLVASTMVLVPAFAQPPAAGILSFEAQDAQGKAFKMSEVLSSNTVMLWFTNLCEGCQADIPEIEALSRRFSGKAVRFVAVSVLGADKETARKVQSKTKLSFPILIDPEGRLSKLVVGSWAENACPLNNVFILGKNGAIQYKGHFPGGNSLAELETELRKAPTSQTNKKGESHVKS